MHTITEKELDFTSNFALTARRNDQIHALVTFFVIDFTHCHKKIRFTTSPEAKHLTHWKQTIFYLDDTITITEGEELYGSLHVRPNKSNHVNSKTT